MAGFFGNIISLRFITGKSSVQRPNTHRTTADMPAIALTGNAINAAFPTHFVKRKWANFTRQTGHIFTPSFSMLFPHVPQT